MTNQEIMQRLADEIMAAAAKALNAGAPSSKDVAAAIFGIGVGALKVEGVSKKDILTEVEKCFDDAINYGSHRGSA
jgi:hypothetical protein